MGGKSIKDQPVICGRCKKDFLVAKWDLDHGKGKYCSRKCSNWGRHDKQPIDRFMDKITKEPNGCWIWKTKSLYPKFWFGTIKVKAHRWSYEHFNKTSAEGKEVCHKCDNPLLGTHQENMQDAGNKGRLSWLAEFQKDRDRYQKLYLESEAKQEDQLFHAIVNTLTQLVENHRINLGDLYDALIVVDHKLYENAVTRLGEIK